MTESLVPRTISGSLSIESRVRSSELENDRLRGLGNATQAVLQFQRTWRDYWELWLLYNQNVESTWLVLLVWIGNTWRVIGSLLYTNWRTWYSATWTKRQLNAGTWLASANLAMKLCVLPSPLLKLTTTIWFWRLRNSIIFSLLFLWYGEPRFSQHATLRTNNGPELEWLGLIFVR